MKLRMAISFLLGGLFTTLLAFVFIRWYLGDSTPVSFSNRSGAVLEAVTISGSGFNASLGEVRPNQTIRARIHPAGESTIRISFRTNGRDISLPVDSYFEGGGGYRLEISVDPSLRASVVVDSFTLRSTLLP